MPKGIAQPSWNFCLSAPSWRPTDVSLLLVFIVIVFTALVALLTPTPLLFCFELFHQCRHIICIVVFVHYLSSCNWHSMSTPMGISRHAPLSLNHTIREPPLLRKWLGPLGTTIYPRGLTAVHENHFSHLTHKSSLNALPLDNHHDQSIHTTIPMDSIAAATIAAEGSLIATLLTSLFAPTHTILKDPMTEWSSDPLNCHRQPNSLYPNCTNMKILRQTNGNCKPLQP